MKSDILIQIINRDAKNNDLFWVTGLAKETWPVLIKYIEKLHPSAAIAVRHYATISQC